VRLLDRTVSRTHARITLGPNGPLIEDAGSRFGTLVAGSAIANPTPLRLGTQIRLGDVTIRVDWDGPPGTAPAGSAAAAPMNPGPGETVVVPIDATLMGLRPAPFPGGGAARPRLRSGWALKRMGADEGDERFILRDLRGGTFLRLEPADAALLDLFDGNHTVVQLLDEAERTGGPGGSGRLARLLADLADRGLLDGVSAGQATTTEPTRLERILKPKEHSSDWVADYFPRAYHHWGRLFFQPLIVTFLVLFALAGFGAFAYLVGARYGTPFVVAHRLLIGSAVFILGRFALVALH
jgi:putative peptide zinc metalloprotease protein